MSDNHLLRVWALDAEGRKVHPYKGVQGNKKGLYSVNLTNDTKKFEGMDEATLIRAIQDGCFRDRGTIRMRPAAASTGTSAFAPVVLDGTRLKDF